MTKRTREIRLEPVSEKDAPFLCALMNRPSVLEALNEVPTKLGDWIDAIDEWNRDEDEEDFIVCQNDTPIGWLGVNGLCGDRVAYLKMAALLPEYQGRGSGTLAIRALLCRMKQRGIRRMILFTDQSNAVARACYEKCGFRTVATLTETMSNGKTVPRCQMEFRLSNE